MKVDIKGVGRVAAAFLILTATSSHAQRPKPSKEERQAETRAREILSRMTLSEKIGLLAGNLTIMVPRKLRPDHVPLGAGYIAGNPKFGIPAQIATDASLGVSNLLDMRKGDVATALPSGLAMAATFNPDLLQAAGHMIGSEAKAKGFNIMLAGGVNLVRDPRAGRNFEYLGEDPLLAGRLVGAQIRGVQSNNIISTIKHFALNAQETGRASATVNIDEALARESDLLAFQIGIEEGRPGSVMCAYNQYQGIFACENAFLLNDVLRRDWGFKGYVMSDWGAVHSTEALLAGLDQQSGEKLDKKRWFTTELEARVKEGRIPESAVDTAARRILRTLFAHRITEATPQPQSINYAANAEVAQRVAEEGIVLLKNEDNLLPLARNAKRIAIIGGHADIGVLSGGGSSQVTPVGGFKKVERIETGPSASFGRRGYGGEAPLAAIQAEFPGAEIIWNNGNDIASAAQSASTVDVVVVFGEKYATEADDNKSLSLDRNGDALISAVLAANPRTVVVLQNGNPVAMPWHDKASAILSAWYPGQRGATALARILVGKVNPSGRLPVTFPADEKQLPNPVVPGSDLPPPDKETVATYGINTNARPFVIKYPEGSDVGYRWFDRTGTKPLFAFGHGLSYTQFAYDGLKVKSGRTFTVSFNVRNIGTLAGADVPQIYASLPGRAKRLIGWQKVHLAPGESQRVSITADPRILANFDVGARHWRVDAMDVKVELSKSAIDPVITTHAKLRAQVIAP